MKCIKISSNYVPECMIFIIIDESIFSISFNETLACPRYALGANTHSVEK